MKKKFEKAVAKAKNKSSLESVEKILNEYCFEDIPEIVVFRADQLCRSLGAPISGVIKALQNIARDEATVRAVMRVTDYIVVAPIVCTSCSSTLINWEHVLPSFNNQLYTKNLYGYFVLVIPEEHLKALDLKGKAAPTSAGGLTNKVLAKKSLVSIVDTLCSVVNEDPTQQYQLIFNHSALVSWAKRNCGMKFMRKLVVELNLALVGRGKVVFYSTNTQQLVISADQSIWYLTQGTLFPTFDATERSIKELPYAEVFPINLEEKADPEADTDLDFDAPSDQGDVVEGDAEGEVLWDGEEPFVTINGVNFPLEDPDELLDEDEDDGLTIKVWVKNGVATVKSLD
jgi:hypothetical protein